MFNSQRNTIKLKLERKQLQQQVEMDAGFLIQFLNNN